MRRGCVHCTASILYASLIASSESTPSTLYLHSLFCVNPFVLALVLLQFLLRVYARTISHPFVYPRTEGSVVDGERRRDGDERREYGRKEARREGAQGKHEISRRKGLLQSVSRSLRDISRSTRNVNHYFIRVNIELELTLVRTIYKIVIFYNCLHYAFLCQQPRLCV